MLFSNLVVAAFIAIAQAAPTSHVQHERRDIAHDSKWIKRASAPRGIKLPVRIAITQRNIENGHGLLMDVSDPASPNYSKHWTAQEVADLFSPTQESVDAVTEWLASAGIGADRHTITSAKSHVGFDATVEELEALVHAKFSVHTNVNTGNDHVFCDEYHVPHTVQRHVDYITPTINTNTLLKTTIVDRSLNEKRGINSVAALPPINLGPANITTSNGFDINADTCYKGLTPACIRQAYGIPAATLAATSNAMGIFEDGDIYDQADLNLFWKNEAPNVPSGTGPTLRSINGATAPESQATEKQQKNGEESLLDFEVAISLIYPQKTVLFQVSDSKAGANEIFGDPFLDAVDSTYCSNKQETCGAYTATNVVSVSYGLSEADYGRAAETRSCNEYMKLGLQGVSVVYASGDSGVASREGCLGSGSTFAPGFPATCPYVTSVGATQVNSGAAITDVESAVSDPADSFYSGGGFSNTFAQPSYQSAALKTYFANHKPAYASNIYNASGRGFPDVSAVGMNIVNYDGGAQILQGGTSASAPIFASIINLINEQRISAGKKPVGFLNPTLYANPSAFTDIVTGSNPGCGEAGFSAVAGWDPVTGLGTPIYSALQKVFLALP